MRRLCCCKEKGCHRGRAAWAAALVLLFSVLLSDLFISAEAEHECSGHDCTICAMISRYCQNRKLLSCEEAALAVDGFSGFLQAGPEGYMPQTAVRTLVSMGVRLND